MNTKSTDEQKLSLPVLTAMVVGSMVGAGIYSLPRNFALEAGPKAAVISWCIAGGGMYMLARIFQLLAQIRPDLDSGIFAYARDGFGGYAGFLSAFGYWMAGCFGNVSYWVLIKSTLGAFIPAFGNGNTPIAIAISSVGIWSFHWMLLRGIKQATLINAILTVVKILPIFVFIGILSVLASAEPFRMNLAESAGALAPQVKGTMLVTVFVFLGIEGASVYSRYAKKRSDVGAATILGFAFVLLLLVLVTLLPYALLMRADIAAMRQPSMATVLGAAVGSTGTVFIGGALIVSVLGAYLAWSLICAEVLFASARENAMPAVFARRNARQLPTAAIWLTSGVVQAFVISTYWSTDAFTLMLRLTSAMALIPYFFVATFGLKAIRALPPSAISTRKRFQHYATAAIATIYTVFLLYACGVELLVMSALLYGPGSLLYIWAQRERGKPLFSRPEWCAFVVVMGGALVAIYELSTAAWR
ncbi:basic amino acid/polyamine antiporter [Paraburkholderia unamae]|uniref:Arginine:ornithine antiporter (APA family) n=1 Tax=Paraburkholderia unamae TaxID=219649 RepID=A0ABX5KET7_9BURK|nr:basic amino acid/polyamine antiporter [Paraburkholderia unamae]PVX72473.1 arginine:ornithine antiporter (APA family) [Paraburkholderia unamae]CAG9251078.1 putative arginine:ornithine antiporter [Paraburkholderia unamae]